MLMSRLTTSSVNLRPMRRLTAAMVLAGLVTAWRLADCPTSPSPSLVKATIDGVVRSPSLFSMTLGLPPSMIATQELVVPRSMPIIFAIDENPLKIQKPDRYLGELAVFSIVAARSLADYDPCRAQQPAVQGIALLNHGQHGICRFFRTFLGHHRLVPG